MVNYEPDEVGKVIIEELKDLKKKLTKQEKQLNLVGWITIVISFCFFVYLVIFTFIPAGNNYSMLVSSLISDTAHYVFIVVLVTVYQRLKVVKKKVDKTEKEYENLRCEVIQKSETLWPPGNGWETRHLFFKYMLDKYDINLYSEH